MDKKVFKIKLSDFDKMITDHSYQVEVISIVNSPEVGKIKFKSGVRKIITYRDESIDGKTIPNYYADIHYEDVFKEKVIKIKEVLFSFVDRKDEKSFLKSDSGKKVVS